MSFDNGNAIIFNNDDNTVRLDDPEGVLGGGNALYEELISGFDNGGTGWNEFIPPNMLILDDYAAGGIGQDYLDGQYGNDVLYGGTGVNLDLDNTQAEIDAPTPRPPFNSFGDPLDNHSFDGFNFADFDLSENGVDAPFSRYDYASDTLIGGYGDDTLFGQMGKDSLFGGSGEDSMFGGRHGDFMDGGTEADDMFGERGLDTMLGGDEFHYQSTTYNYEYGQYEYYFWDYNGGHSGDWMSGGRARDLMDGGMGFDTMYGDQCADTMSGGLHYDLMFGGNGADSMYGGDAQGNDTGDLLGPYYGNNPGYGCDYRYGYSGNGDSMFGGYGDDWMSGGVGDDLMRGNAGDDEMYGNQDDDLMTGNRGDDFMSGGEGADDMSGGSGNDTMEGNEGDDNMFGDTGDDVMSGGEGHDQMHGGEGDDLMAGDAGNDSMSGDDGNDTMNGNAGDDCMDGGAGRDIVNGNEGNDRLDGGAGIDTVSGGDGDDVIYTSDGIWTDYEVLNGGAGNDTFVYNAVFNEDDNTATGTDGYTFIEDFTAYEDTLQLCISGNFSLECDFGEPGQPNLDAWDIINRQLMDALGDTNATGQHAVRVYDNGTDTLILFDDTLPTGQDASDPEHDLDETIWLKGVTGTANGGNEFASLDDMLNAGYNIEIRAELPDELAEWQDYYDSAFVPCSLDCECDYGNPFEDNEIPA